MTLIILKDPLIVAIPDYYFQGAHGYPFGACDRVKKYGPIDLVEYMNNEHRLGHFRFETMPK